MANFFNSPAAVLQAISDTLQQSGSANLPSQWPNIAATCQSLSYGYIVRALTKRGYTLAQILAWDFGADYELNIAIFFALQRGGTLANVSGAFLATFDLRKDLDEVVLTIGGAVQDPLGTAGLPSSGDVDTSLDIFVLPPSAAADGSPDDFPGPGRGADTRF